jgi:hypothetical protein
MLRRRWRGAHAWVLRRKVMHVQGYFHGRFMIRYGYLLYSFTRFALDVVNLFVLTLSSGRKELL